MCPSIFGVNFPGQNAQSCRAVCTKTLAVRGYHRATGGYFIYASTDIKFINEEYESPVAQILGTSELLSSCPIPRLPTLKLMGYGVMFPDFEIKKLHLPCIQNILGVRRGHVELTLRGLRSLDIEIYMRDRLIHASFRDFLLSRATHCHVDSEERTYTTLRDVLFPSLQVFGPSYLCLAAFDRPVPHHLE